MKISEYLKLSILGITYLSFSNIAMSASVSYPKGYYDSLEGKCGAELMEAIKERCIDHTEISYSGGTWNAFKSTDVRTIGGVDYWWDMYSDNLVQVSSGHGGLNVEHSVANSWWGGTKNMAYKDIVHLNPSNSNANSRKSNYPLGEIAADGGTWDNGVTFIGKAKAGQGGGASYVYEPADEYKGDFARVFMYMFCVYNDITWKSNTAWMYDTSSSTLFQSWASQLLMKWSNADPVSDKEIYRNNGIETEQGNRNPFIDLPQLADYIWGSRANIPFKLDGSTPDPINPDNPENPEELKEKTYEWLLSTDTSLTPGWTYENVTLEAPLSYIWSWKNQNGNYYLNSSAYVSGTAHEAEAYAWSPEVNLTGAKSVTLSFSHAAKFQTTLRTLCSVAVKDVNTGEIFTEPITIWPVAGAWKFVKSNDIDLSAYAGRTVLVGLKYGSDAEGADTWEINNMNLAVKYTDHTSGVDLLPADSDEDDSFLVEVWGRNILAPVGARIFDLNGREVEGEGVAAGVYVVVKPSFDHAVKVIVK